LATARGLRHGDQQLAVGLAARLLAHRIGLALGLDL